MREMWFGLAALAAFGAPGGWDPVGAQPTTRLPDYRERGVTDPRAYVAETYAAYRRATDEPGQGPETDYAHSDRLNRLFEVHDAAVDGVSPDALDFDWWVNEQDWRLSEVIITEERPDASHRIIVARFTNSGRMTTNRFQFIRQGGRWFLDDIVSASRAGGWTLSALLRPRR